METYNTHTYALRMFSEFTHGMKKMKTTNSPWPCTLNEQLPIEDRDRETQGLRNPRQTQVSSGSGKLDSFSWKCLPFEKKTNTGFVESVPILRSLSSAFEH